MAASDHISLIVPENGNINIDMVWLLMRQPSRKYKLQTFTYYLKSFNNGQRSTL